MFYLAQNENEPLVWGEFEAWDYGPVHPELCHKAKIFKALLNKAVFLNEEFMQDRFRKQPVYTKNVASNFQT